MSRKSVFLVCLLWFGFGLFILAPQQAEAQNMDTYTVKSGDTMWKISLRYKIGLSEIIEANPQINNPDLIYPNQKLNIPIIDQIKKIEHRVIQLTNQEREKYGLKPLRPDWQLSRVARHKSKDMRDRGYFSHTSPTYGSPFKMMRNYKISFRSAAENIAMGQSTPQEVVRGWMNSAGHKKNILNPTYTHIGVGYAKGGYGRYYWTQMFMAR